MRANRDRDKMYMCMGENIKSNARLGDVGDVKSLMGWCMHLSHRDREELEVFFDESYTNNDIVNYIYNSWGKKVKSTMKKSILQDEKECYICHTTANLQLHHCYFGTANRKLSDQDGCVVYLCVDHHTGAHGIHTHRELDLKLKRTMQTCWMEHYGKTVDDFIQRYGKNYL